MLIRAMNRMPLPRERHHGPTSTHAPMDRLRFLLRVRFQRYRPPIAAVDSLQVSPSFVLQQKCDGWWVVRRDVVWWFSACDIVIGSRFYRVGLKVLTVMYLIAIIQGFYVVIMPWYFLLLTQTFSWSVPVRWRSWMLQWDDRVESIRFGG